jgi:hypothetical protein
MIHVDFLHRGIAGMRDTLAMTPIASTISFLWQREWAGPSKTGGTQSRPFVSYYNPLLVAPLLFSWSTAISYEIGSGNWVIYRPSNTFFLVCHSSLLSSSLSSYAGHYILLIGYDAEDNSILYLDPAVQNFGMFEHLLFYRVCMISARAYERMYVYMFQ